MFSKSSKQHLKETEMTRWQHFKHAINMAWELKKASMAVVIHAIVPSWFTQYATTTCKNIVKENKL
tara:strand:- start:84 stop:281 length:198 start_codon:yes stop_codon:yes gene_type:complete